MTRPAADRSVRGLDPLLVLGTGLIGTSIALAARRAGVRVLLWDADDDALAAAVEMGAGRPAATTDACAHAVACVPPSAVAEVLRRVQSRNPKATLSDVASAKANVVAEVEALLPEPSRFVGAHPMAGRERGGPLNARGDLFRGRPWIVTPTLRSSPEAVAAATALAQLCGAVPVLMEPAAHDVAVAAVSHLPQLLASALAAQTGSLDTDALAIAGPALADMTRLASSPATLWAEIARANAEAIAPALAALAGELSDVAAAVAQGGEPAYARVLRLLESGNSAAQRIPSKRGHVASAYGHVTVVVPDRPGGLLAVLTALAAADINVDDVRVEHVPGEPTGLVDLATAPDAVGAAVETLRRAGMTAYPAERSLSG